MPNVLLIDPFGGIAGDMFLGALLDLGANESAIRVGLASLNLPNWSLEIDSTSRRHLGCTWARFHIPEETGHRHLPEILERIQASSLTERAKNKAMSAFRFLAEAEAHVHRIPVETVHFHEVGAADAILDICGSCIALDDLGIEQAYCGPLPGGSGTVRCAHGDMPLPAPAVLELLKGYDIQLGQGSGEMVTPTGAALVRAWSKTGLPEAGSTVRPIRSGYGAGTRHSSVLRLTLAETQVSTSEWESDEVTVLESNIDDSTPEHLAFLLDELLAAGALDVSYTPITMKKSRPAVQMSCIAAVEQTTEMAQLIFQHTGTLGVRIRQTTRIVRPRQVFIVETQYGAIQVKVTKRLPNVAPHCAPEFEDCARLARQHSVPLNAVFEAARISYSEQDDKA